MPTKLELTTIALGGHEGSARNLSASRCLQGKERIVKRGGGGSVTQDIVNECE